MNFLGLTEQEADYKRSGYVVLPVPYEQTTTFGKGTALGPAAILAASQEVELYDEELGFEPYRCGIATSGPLEPTTDGPERMIAIINETVQQILSHNKIPITLGGEHTVSVGPVSACVRTLDNLSVLQIDAHADLRESYQGSRFSHACAMARIRDITEKTVGVGIRNLSIEEAETVKKRDIPLIFAQDIHSGKRKIEDAIEYLTDNVYITIDLDGFDPSVIPGVGTPEPGGLGWYEVLAFLRRVCHEKRIVGFDVVELMPIPPSLVSDFTAAKLIYKIIGYMEAAK